MRLIRCYLLCILFFLTCEITGRKIQIHKSFANKSCYMVGCGCNKPHPHVHNAITQLKSYVVEVAYVHNSILFNYIIS